MWFIKLHRIFVFVMNFIDSYLSHLTYNIFLESNLVQLCLSIPMAFYIIQILVTSDCPRYFNYILFKYLYYEINCYTYLISHQYSYLHCSKLYIFLYSFNLLILIVYHDT